MVLQRQHSTSLSKMVSQHIFLLTIAFISSAVFAKQFCRTATPIPNYVLSGQPHNKLSNKNFGNCVFACESDPQCHSTNYYFKTKVCELNRRPVQEEWLTQGLVAVESSMFTLNIHTIALQGYCERQCPHGESCLLQTTPLEETFTCSCPPGFAGNSCEGSAIGMESGRIPSHNISSSSYKSGYRPSQGRLNSNTGWMAAESNGKQFLQLHLGSIMRFVAIATQGLIHEQYGCWVKRYFISFSMDVQRPPSVWRPYKEDGAIKNFTGNYDATTVHVNNLLQPHQASAIQVTPTAWHNCVGMRIEFYSG